MALEHSWPRASASRPHLSSLAAGATDCCRAIRRAPSTAQLAAISSAVDAGRCAHAAVAAQRFSNLVGQLPRNVNTTLIRNLGQGAETVSELVANHCTNRPIRTSSSTSTTSSSTPTTTTTTVTQTTTETTPTTHQQLVDLDHDRNESDWHGYYIQWRRWVDYRTGRRRGRQPERTMTGTTTIAGRYRIEGRLGVGGMSTVHLAFDNRLERYVAIKLLAEHLADDPTFVSRFRREALAAARLVHPNIVQVFDFGFDAGHHQHFIVMEHVPGNSCAELLRDRGHLDVDEALEIVTQACRGLDYAHRHGVVHRDVKPGNLLVSDSEVVKLADFGIARATDQSSITQVGSVLGTAAYLVSRAGPRRRGRAAGGPVLARGRHLSADLRAAAVRGQLALRAGAQAAARGADAARRARPSGAARAGTRGGDVARDRPAGTAGECARSGRGAPGRGARDPPRGRRVGRVRHQPGHALHGRRRRSDLRDPGRAAAGAADGSDARRCATGRAQRAAGAACTAASADGL